MGKGIQQQRGLESIKPYVPGKPIEDVKREYGLNDVIKMASNENPLGVSPRALAAMQAALPKLNHYPDAASYDFRSELAEHFDVLHRVSSGDLNAQVVGVSEVEMLESLKQVTNNMIQSVAATIAEREQAQADLSRSEERFRTFAQKAPIGITIMQAGGKFIYINPTFTEIFGYTNHLGMGTV